MQSSFVNGFIDEIEKIAEKKDKSWWQRHKYKVIGAATVIPGAIAARYGYKRFYKKPPTAPKVQPPVRPGSTGISSAKKALDDAKKLKADMQAQGTTLDKLTRQADEMLGEVHKLKKEEGKSFTQQLRDIAAKTAKKERFGRRVARQEGIKVGKPIKSSLPESPEQFKKRMKLRTGKGSFPEGENLRRSLEGSGPSIKI